MTAPLEAVEPVADVLRSHAPGGVAIEQPVRHLDADHAFEIDASRPVLVRAYVSLAAERQRTALRRRVGRDLRALPWELSLRTRLLAPRTLAEWSEAWKAHWRVQKVGRRLVICPSWLEHTVASGEVVLQLDPGLAFGTGDHPTTRLCLRALDERIRPGARVLDVGCGSGILAIAAVLLGASGATALDTDPVAVEAAISNARSNAVDSRLAVAQGSVGPAWPFAEPPSTYDVVVANVSSAFAVENACELVRLTAPDGALIVSGVPLERGRDVQRALGDAGAAVRERRREGGWLALVASPR